MEHAKVPRFTSRHRKRLAALTLLLFAAVACGCSKQSANYTGTWKSNCSDFWGVLIKPAADGLYAVTFCGLSGCLKAGEWTPDTRIENDPMYQVVSSTEIRIKRNDGGYFTYVRCSADPFWQIKTDT